ncbi:MAG: endonuclease/exonuclease/phosphatase family protein [Planctomycetota bacterium]|nr:endonuclease/exonuclease/phosphatase family protein [Planctomycetota bacterium]
MPKHPLLVLVCPLFGLLGFSCHGVSPGNRSTPKPLELMSYNIRHGVGMDGVLDLDRIAEVIRREKPDLVALQEIDRNCIRSGNRDIAQELGDACGMQAYFAKFMDYQGGEYGLAVLSRLPVVEVTSHRLPDGAEPRVALEVEVQVDGLPSTMSFVCIHNDWTDDGIRQRQVNSLLGALRDDTHPIVLAGDFNALPGDTSTDLFLCSGWNNLGNFREHTFPSDAPTKTIDYFMVRGFENHAGKTLVLDERMASDHRPIRVTLSFDN